MDKLIKQVKDLLDQGVYDPQELFDIVYPHSRKHYSTVRTAIHLAKTDIKGNF